MLFKRMEKVRIYPSRSQERELICILSVCCDIYNAALTERREAYSRFGLSIGLSDQAKSLTEVRREWSWVAGVYQEVEANALRRLDNAYKAFFRRVKSGENPGFPRFRSKRRYDTFEYPHGQRCVGVDAERRRIKLPTIGSLRFRNGRAIPDSFGRVIISCKAGRWYACFECQREQSPLPAMSSEVGIDVGTVSFLATSTGDFEENPRYANESRATVECHQWHVSRCKRGSKRRRKAIVLLARSKQREANRRRDNHHKVARKLVNAHDFIAHEKLQILNMVRSAAGTIEAPGKNVAQKKGLNRSISDAAWGQFLQILRDKAEEAGRVIVGVDPRHTSQTCAECDYVDAGNRRSHAKFLCLRCGHADNADVNEARVILKSGIRAWFGLAVAA